MLICPGIGITSLWNTLKFGGSGKIFHNVDSLKEKAHWCRSTIIDYLRATITQPRTAILYLYFDYKDSRQTALNVLASLLKQLLSHLPIIPAALLELHKISEKRATSPTLSEYATRFLSCSKEFECIYVAVDAFDECDRAEQETVLAFVQDFLAAGIKLVLTSRPHIQALRKLQENGSTLPVEADDDDVKKYIATRLAKEAPDLAQELRAQIIKKLNDGAKGM